jgi:hypothetical protein
MIVQDGKPTGAIKMLKTGFDGMQGYFEWLGLNNPRSFAALLGRVLPTQLNIKTSSTWKSFCEISKPPSISESIGQYGCEHT